MTQTDKQPLIIQGFWYDGQQSHQQTAQLCFRQDGDIDILTGDLAESSVDGSAPAQTLRRIAKVSPEDMRISSRLGNSARYLYFSDGQKFETSDNDRVDDLAAQLKMASHRSWAYRLESHWRFAVLSSVLVAGLCAWLLTGGIPLVAKGLATLTPQIWITEATKGSLALLDDGWMEPSQLPEAQQQDLLAHFQPIIDQYPDHNIRVLFRTSEQFGANAFAFPDGTIVFTDGIVELSTHPDELLSVMAHEVGHVVEQHGVRNIIQGSMLSFMFVIITGDISMMGELFLGIPAVLTQLGYSRDFEHEADDFSLDYLRKNNIDPGHFSRLMARMEQAHCEKIHSHSVADDSEGHHSDSHHIDDHKEDPAPTVIADADAATETQNDVATTDVVEKEPLPCVNPAWQKYLSTHPATQERLDKFSTHAH